MSYYDQEMLREYSGKDWCFALHGNHDEHQCHLKPGHETAIPLIETGPAFMGTHECYCGVWW